MLMHLRSYKPRHSANHISAALRILALRLQPPGQIRGGWGVSFVLQGTEKPMPRTSVRSRPDDESPERSNGSGGEGKGCIWVTPCSPQFGDGQSNLCTPESRHQHSCNTKRHAHGSKLANLVDIKIYKIDLQVTRQSSVLSLPK